MELRLFSTQKLKFALTNKIFILLKYLRELQGFKKSFQRLEDSLRLLDARCRDQEESLGGARAEAGRMGAELVVARERINRLAKENKVRFLYLWEFAVTNCNFCRS